MFSLILFLACNNQPEEADTTTRQDSAARIDKTIVEDNLPVLEGEERERILKVIHTATRSRPLLKENNPSLQL